MEHAHLTNDEKLRRARVLILEVADSLDDRQRKCKSCGLYEWINFKEHTMKTSLVAMAGKLLAMANKKGKDKLSA